MLRPPVAMNNPNHPQHVSQVGVRAVADVKCWAQEFGCTESELRAALAPSVGRRRSGVL